MLCLKRQSRQSHKFGAVVRNRLNVKNNPCYTLLASRYCKHGLVIKEDKAVQQDEEKVLNKIQKAGNAERIREKKKKASALKKAENRQNEIDRLFTKMYEDRACEKITERNFIMLSGKYQKEQIELEQQITNLREELSKMEQDMIGAEKWIELIKEYSVPKELTAPLLNAMIEKILIHEATTNEDNERIQEIEIYYRFIGKVE